MAIISKSSISRRTASDPKALDCVCSHEYQDKRFGKGKRLHNPTKDGYRCSVCGREIK